MALTPMRQSLLSVGFMALFMALVRRELKALWRDPWQLALISYIPLLGILCLWWLFKVRVYRGSYPWRLLTKTIANSAGC